MHPPTSNGDLNSVFQAALGLAAILFGVFGFLYALRASTIAQRPTDLPPLVPRLRVLYKVTAVLIVVCAAVALVAGFSLSHPDPLVAGLVATLVAVVVALAGISVYMSWKL